VAAFVPLLAIVILMLGDRTAWIGKDHRNHPLMILLLGAVIALSVLAGSCEIRNAWL